VPEATFTLVQLRYFVAAAELGSMTNASRELVVSQSAISSAIAQLERELGVQLLVRHHAKGLTLTPAGERFLGQARGLLSHAGELVACARGVGSLPTGELSVGCFTALSPFYLPRLLSACAERHPDLQVEIVEGDMGQVERAVLDGRCEVALLYDLDLAPELRTETVALVPPQVVLPANHPMADAAEVSLPELAAEPMVMLDQPHSRDYYRSLFRRVRVEPRVQYRSAGYETVRSLVAEGHGYSILNQRPGIDETYSGGRVVVRPIREQLPVLAVVLAKLAVARPTARATAFIELCRSVL
jgi:DNA-binding transcriptional LysR family regulator